MSLLDDLQNDQPDRWRTQLRKPGEAAQVLRAFRDALLDGLGEGSAIRAAWPKLSHFADDLYGGSNLGEPLVLSAVTAQCYRDIRHAAAQFLPGARQVDPPGDPKSLAGWLILWHTLRGEVCPQNAPTPTADRRWWWPVRDAPGTPLALDWPAEVRRSPAANQAAEAFVRLEAQMRKAAGRRYQVLFPTWEDNVVLAAHLTQVDGEVWPSSDQQLLVAPWSIWTLGQGLKDRGHPQDHLNQLLREVPALRSTDADKRPRFLLELSPASRRPENRPRSLQVTGNSLDLAVCLAAWAVLNQRSLRRLCVTGQLDGAGTIEHVEGIAGDRGKLAALCRYLGELCEKGTPQRFTFLMPDRSKPGTLVPEIARHLPAQEQQPLLTINGRKRHQEVEVDTLSKLLEHRQFLTDAFDDYRTAVLDWTMPAGEVRQLAGEAAASAFAEPERTHVPICPEFDSDPAPLAAGIVRALVGHVNDAEQRSHGTAAEMPVPLLLPLEECADRPEDFADRLVEALVAGIDHWRERHGLRFGADRFERDLLHNLVRFERDKFWPVVYCRNSLDMLPYEDVQRRLDLLWEHLPERAGHRILIAGDYHHYLMLHHHLRLPAPATAPAGG